MPPLWVLTVPDGAAEFKTALERRYALDGALGVLPQDCKIEVIGASVPTRTLKARTSLGLMAAPGEWVLHLPHERRAAL